VRSTLLPDVSTIAESALPGFEAVLRYGLVAPPGTPQPMVERLHAALNTALASPDVRARLAIDGAEPLPGTPADYAADIDREEAQWSKVVKTSGAKAE
jgi:tripartite-type tricarboxylate transporter receptor subunit TctC